MELVINPIMRQAKTALSFGSGMGGAGKTNLVAGIGAILAIEGHDVILCDCDLDGANLHTALGIMPPEPSISEFMLGRVNSLEELIVPTNMNNLRLISGARNTLNTSNYHHSVKSKLIKNLYKLECDYLLIDMSSGTGFNVVDLFLMADAGILVTTPEPGSVELLYRFIKTALFRQLRNIVEKPQFKDFLDELMLDNTDGNLLSVVEKVLDKIEEDDHAMALQVEEKFFKFDFKLIVNMTRDHADQSIGPSVVEVIKKYYGFDITYLGHIPYDARVSKANKIRHSFITEYKSSDTAAFMGYVKKQLIETMKNKFVSKQLKLTG